MVSVGVDGARDVWGAWDVWVCLVVLGKGSLITSMIGMFGMFGVLEMFGLTSMCLLCLSGTEQSTRAERRASGALEPFLSVKRITYNIYVLMMTEIGRH